MVTPWWQTPPEELYKDAGHLPHYCSECGNWFERHGWLTENDYVDVTEGECDFTHAEEEL